MKKRINSRMLSSVFMLALIIISQTSGADTLSENSDVSVIAELEMASNMENGNTQKLQLQIVPELTVDFTHNWQFTALGRFRGDVRDNINPNRQAKAELREIYVETSIGDTFLTLGKQQIVWGKADGLKILDVINPQDFREFILDDFDNSRIPLWTANTEIPLNDSVLQLIWIPDQTYSSLPEPGSLYAFKSPTLVPVTPSGVSVNLLPVEKPKRFFADADYAIRLSSFIGGWDITFNYLYHYVDIPILFRSLRPGPQPTVSVAPRFERTHLIGGTFSTAFASIVLRGELAYSTDLYFLTNNANDSDGVIKSGDLSYVLGLDWSATDKAFLSTQLFQSRITDTQPGLIRDTVDTTITFLARHKSINNTLVAEILLLQNLNHNDGLARPKISYEWNDELNIWAGLDVFYGDKKGLFGQFDQNDRLLIGLDWSM